VRIFVAGQKLFGAAVLALCLKRGHDMAGVSSPPLASDGRQADRLRAAAARAGVAWMPAGALRFETLPHGVDLIIAAHSHDFIGRRTRLKCKLGAVGFHPSLLPLHRGRDALRWSIRMGERVTGGTVYWLGDSLDAGDVAAQAHVFIRPDDTAEELWRRELFPLGLRLVERVLIDLEARRVIRVPQDEALATWEPSIGRPPLFRPELPQLGTIEGYDCVRVRA
jgi:methionyl-tRNA formyltransferase